MVEKELKIEDEIFNPADLPALRASNANVGYLLTLFQWQSRYHVTTNEYQSLCSHVVDLLLTRGKCACQ